MSIASDLAALGATLKNNLEAKGVTGLNSNMGLTTLANKILNISPGSGGIKLQLYYEYPDGWIGKLTKDGVGVSNANIIVHEYSEAAPDNYDYSSTIIPTDQNGEINLPATMSGVVKYILEYNGVFSNIADIDAAIARYDTGSGVYDLTISAADAVGEGDTLSIRAFVTDSNDNGLIGEVVTFSFSQNNNVFDTFEIVTDNYGDAVCEYVRQNRGDVTVTVTCDGVTKHHSVEDILFYDDASSDSTSNYTLNKVKMGNTVASLIFVNDHYVLSGIPPICCFGGITFDNLENEDNIEIRFDVKLTQSSACNQAYVLVSNSLSDMNGMEGYRIRGDKLFQEFGKNGESTKYNHSTGFTDQYYTMVFAREGDMISTSLYNEAGTLLYSQSKHIDLDLTTNCYYSLLTQTEKGATYGICLKNIKIKSLE